MKTRTLGVRLGDCGLAHQGPVSWAEYGPVVLETTTNASIRYYKIRIINLITFRGVNKTADVGCKPREDGNSVFTIFIVFLLYRVPRVSQRHRRSPVYKAQLENVQLIRELSGLLMIQ